MKKILRLWVVLVAFAATPALALEPPPQLPAQAWLLVDYATGNVLVDRHADRQLPPASLTKLMSAYLIFDELRSGKIELDDDVPISRRAAYVRGSRVPLIPGRAAKVEDLIKSMLLRSANNATVVLAEYIAGSEAAFVERMNARARAWELTGTRFVNSTGLPGRGHVSTARDVSRIAAALIRDFPDYYSWFSLRDFTFGNFPVRNSNRLLWRDDSVDGMKTGYTRRAGWCLVASAVQKDMRLIATVLGAPNRAARLRASQRLLDYGFRNFETRLVYAAHNPAAEARVWMGYTSSVPLGLTEDLYLTLPRGAYGRLEKRLDVQEMPHAPIASGQPLGVLTLSLDGNVFGEYPLVALRNVSGGGPVQRTVDNLLLWFY